MPDAPDQPQDAAARRYTAETIEHSPDDESARRLACDVALATELLTCGALTERQVSETLADWSIYGAVSLRQHLQNTGLLSAEQLHELDERVEKSLARTPLPEKFEEYENPVASTFARFDTSGRVARMLGVRSASGGPTEGADTRSGMTRYRIIRLLGQGGLGRVWLARDLDLQRLVALKEIVANRENAASIQRFRNEAEITGRLEHPGIVPIYQLASDGESGRIYYTMRFLGKGTLQDSIAEYHERRLDGEDDPMLLRHLLSSFVSVCYAIGHAHSHKVIHRDLKPENVVIDNFGQVIVIDWGLAKVLDDSEADQFITHSSLSRDIGRTSEGQVLGTPLFMAPEQAAGRLDEIDSRTDIYGLGAILFSICTGRPPHEATHARSTSGQSRAGAARELFTAIASGPTPLATELNPELDPALAAICAKAMARRRYARYQEASELALEVERWMAGEPVTAYKEPPGRRVRRWILNHQKLSQLLAGLIAVAIAAATTLAMVVRHDQAAKNQARFQQMVGDIREIELQIRDLAMDLGKQARFMASLPPIQGIIRARAGDEGDSEEVWRERLEMIYLGLLRANPDYLAVTFVADDQSEPASPRVAPADEAQAERLAPSHDVLRVERNASDRTFIRSVPKSRLASSEDDPLLAEVMGLELGDVVFSLEPRKQQALHAAKTRRLISAVPVFDEKTGSPFGMVMVEVDLNAKLLAALSGIGDLVGDTYVAGGRGEVWVTAGPMNPPTADSGNQSFAELCPEAAGLESSATAPLEETDKATYYGKLFREQPNSQGVIIFARLPED